VKPIPVSFHVGPLVVHMYGIGLALTFWFGFRYLERRLRRAGYPWQWLTGAFLWIVAASIVGARAMHVVANLSYYSAHPVDILAVWHGGLSSFGGLLFGIPTGVLLFRRSCPTLPSFAALDLAAPVLMASWGLGRLLGPQLMVAGGGHPTTQWFGMYYAGQAGKRIPVPLIQSIDCFVVFGVLLLIENRYRNRPSGFVLGAAMAFWGLTRFYEERLWLGEEGHLGSLLVQGAGLGLFIVGLAVLAVLWRRQRNGSLPVSPLVARFDAYRASGGPRTRRDGERTATGQEARRGGTPGAALEAGTIR
jgi:phosphatidylglycerol:prolipoprotein diacylglycerol transferase